MKDHGQAMRRVLPILAFILVLIFRQAPPELWADHKTFPQSFVKEINTSSRTQGLGWIEIWIQDDSNELPLVFPPFQNEEPHEDDIIIPLDFTFFFHDRSNPLLIDRPPPFLPV